MGTFFFFNHYIEMKHWTYYRLSTLYLFLTLFNLWMRHQEAHHHHILLLDTIFKPILHPFDKASSLCLKFPLISIHTLIKFSIQFMYATYHVYSFLCHNHHPHQRLPHWPRMETSPSHHRRKVKVVIIAGATCFTKSRLFVELAIVAVLPPPPSPEF